MQFFLSYISSDLTMGKQHSRMRPKIDRKTVFGFREQEVYRIPALFYDRDGQTLMAFAEKRRTSNDNSSVALVMATGKLEKDETTLEVKVIISSGYFILLLLLMTFFSVSSMLY